VTDLNAELIAILNALKPLIFLITLSLILTLLGVALSAFARVGQSLWGDTVDKVQTRMSESWWRDVRLGALHGLGILMLLAISRSLHLLFLVAVVWLGLAVACLWMGTPALVESLAKRVGGSPWARALGGGLCLTWACAVPYLGQALLIVLVLGTYGAALGTILESRKQPPKPQSPTAPLREQGVLLPTESTVKT
jgi:hypothetical protein